MQIPANVYTKYAEAMSLFSSLDNFGVQCTLVYERIVPLAATPTDIRQRLTINPQAGQAGMIRGSEATKLVETTESITLRVYSDKKSFDKVGAFDFVSGSCMTIGTIAQMDNLRRASFIIINSGSSGEMKLQRSGEVLIWGLNGEYCVANWTK
jgi:hypothetical protein